MLICEKCHRAVKELKVTKDGALCKKCIAGDA